MIYSFVPSPEFLLANGVYRTQIDGLFFLPHQAHQDHRGFYAELSRIPEIEAVIKRPFIIKQINISHSFTNVIRGIHAEDWHKLLTITQGTAYCVWVDLRPDSPTFGDGVSMTMGTQSSALFGSVFVSRGIGNSFCVLDGPLDYLYAVDALYQDRDRSHDVAISLFDPQLSIPWPIAKDQLIISDRDLAAKNIQELFPSLFKSQN